MCVLENCWYETVWLLHCCLHGFFTKLYFGLFLYSSRPAGRPCAVLHQMMRINTEVRYTFSTTLNALLLIISRKSLLILNASALTVTILSAAFDRVLESTSTKEKMAKYQAAVLKQGGPQAVSSHSMTKHIMSLNITAVHTSCVSRPYLCVQPSKLLRLDCLPSSCFAPFFLSSAERR